MHAVKVEVMQPINACGPSPCVEAIAENRDVDGGFARAYLDMGSVFWANNM